MKDPQKLLKAYATEQSEEAFSTLVSSYIDLVYSVAKRQVNGDPHLAQDITQTVFSDLAKKAAGLSINIQLGGWLHRHTCFVASNFRRSERRRLNRETQAMQMETLTPPEEEGWQELAPELDLAINQLNEPDRSAIVMRFFERKSHRDIGRALSTSEDSAQKRVTRAIDKLRSILAQQGVALSGPMLALLIENNGLASPPEGLALQISRTTQPLAKITATTPGETAAQFIPSTLKLGASLAASVAVIALVIFQGDERPNTPDDANTTTETASPLSQPLKNPNSKEQGEFSNIVATTHNSENIRSIKLIIQSKETSERLSGVRIQHRAQLIDHWDVKSLTANRAGEILIPFDWDQLKMLQLITQIEGYADTRLEWHPSRGESIPPEFTLELNPAPRIGGIVVDINGQPVSGAKVGFNHKHLQEMRTRPLSFEFGWIEVETDDDGQWEIHRIANDMIPLIYGSARHNDYVNSPLIFTSRDRMLTKELETGNHRFILAPALSLSGIVTDEHDIPIPNAEIIYGRLRSGDHLTTESDLEGRFFLSGCHPGSELLTANAGHFAPKTITVEVEPKSQEIRVSLERGRRAIIRVLDSHDDPISGAKVRYNNHDSVDPIDPLTMSWGDPYPPVQVDFQQSTDREGLITWFDAPNQALVFAVSAEGFTASEFNQFKPDDKEHEIILQPALVVTGTVVDKATRTPIAKAQVTTGWTVSDGTENPTPKWNTLEVFRINSSGGEFYQSFEEPATREALNPFHVLKFEAEGYQPFVTRPIKAGEGVVTLNIELTQGEP
ncbi:sigma-70 family RNA polymerase sigma factor [bacterium]|jgi:RNA polymerase sigma factor (sigma-70 family)|nr:sigma-70 family RNA polymerase sigma factor [bacterium]